MKRLIEGSDDEFVIDMENVVENNPSIHKPLYYMRENIDAKAIVQNREFQKLLRAVLEKQEAEMRKTQDHDEAVKIEASKQNLRLMSSTAETEEEILLIEIEIIAKKINKSL